MKTTVRQEKIIYSVVKEYINSARPVSSNLLWEKHYRRLSPATLRIEMNKLTSLGYLLQPHTSAGRVPTDKAYRFFVDNFFEQDKNGLKKNSIFNGKKLEEKAENSVNLARVLAKSLALASSSVALTYLKDFDILWKEGFSETFEQPEFKNSYFRFNFLKMIDALEEELKDFLSEDFQNPRIYIGKENPIPNSRDFSMIVSKCFFPKRKQGALIILGPKRMEYEKNIHLINSALRFLESCN